ncbi:hypothetical protein BXY82_1735 [Gelidibacter sediminis]|uniref:Uncharacterized protein n=1 Tax=Gelidibacter sediminis TaxID=1608710 RepID=A0A4R7PXN2_9FLAO|nr:hypothetical protein [Gelidibacter sediminis]TDU39705.1 hypothetical protein BXY82_1735 [Gelidibacter sediminis]
MAVRQLLALLLIAYAPLLFAQEEKVYFDDALSEHLKRFNNQSDIALKQGLPEKVDILFDSLVKKHLKNTYIFDLKFKKASGGKLYTETINQPFLLITKNSAIIQTKAEIRKINSLASEYKNRVTIIVVYWDKRRIAKKKARSYNNHVTVVYADERNNNMNNALSIYKHSFGVPACFYINKNKQIVDIDRKFFLKNLNATTKNLFVEKTQKSISDLLESENKTNTSLIIDDFSIID